MTDQRIADRLAGLVTSYAPELTAAPLPAKPTIAETRLPGEATPGGVTTKARAKPVRGQNGRFARKTT